MVKNPPANARDVRDTGLIPGSGRSPGQPPLSFGERNRDCSPGHARKEGPQLARTRAGDRAEEPRGRVRGPTEIGRAHV